TNTASTGTTSRLGNGHSEQESAVTGGQRLMRLPVAREPSPRASPVARLVEQARPYMNYTKRFIMEPGANVKLRKVDPGYIDPDVTEPDALAETKKLCKRLRKLQASLYSEKQRSVLLVLQALDTAGKEGGVNHAPRPTH